MGNCYVVRRGGSSSGGTGFNYVEGFQGIDSLNPIFSPVRDASNQGIYLTNTNLYTRAGQSLTIEICMNLDANRNRSGRYFEFNHFGVILSDEYWNDDYYIEIALNGDNWYFSRQETQIFEQDITMALVIEDDSSKIYRNGSLLLTSSDVKNSMIPDTYNNIDGNDLHIMEGDTSSRYAPGKFYAFRFYNKALTASEIAQNYQEDLKLISLVNGS